MDKKNKRKNTKTVLLISIILFIISLSLPAYTIDRADDEWPSFGLLFLGWLGAFMGGGSALVWFANPLIFISWILTFKSIKKSIILGILASVLATSFLFFDTVISSEAPTYSVIKSYNLGYWLWLASICFFTIGISVIQLIKRKS